MQTIQVRTLGCGIRLTCVTTGQWKTSLMSACFALPLDGEGRSCAALLPSMLRSCCSVYPGRQSVAVRLDELYGARLEPFVTKRGEAQLIGVMADAIDERYADGERESLVHATARLLADVLLRPALPFDEGILQTEAAALRARIAALPNNKRAWVVRRMYQLMCSEEAYRLTEYGDEDAVAAITAQQLTGYYQTVLQTAPLELFYCGSLEADRVEQIFCEQLSGITGRDRLIRPAFSAPSDVAQLRTAVEEETVNQGKLAIGIRTGITARDPLYPAMVLFNSCYGGSTGSRLFRTVREEQSLCYYASSQTDKLKGVMAVSSGVENENAERAVREMLRQLECIQNGELTDDEVEQARRFVLASLRSMGDSPYALESFYQTQAAAGLDDTLEQLTERIQQVTSEQIAEAARRAKPDFVYFLKGAAV
ncbi:MAG: EF-P 5-aminopentanol modification-associated protein YfmF [Butyricicoccus sp.]